jgi:hypothetical protein
MKKPLVEGKAKRRRDLLAACETARQRGNRLTGEEGRKLLAGGLSIIYGGMKKKPIKLRPKKKIDWDVACERTRQRCNKLSDEERHRFRAEALRIIYSADAEATARSR